MCIGKFGYLGLLGFSFFPLVFGWADGEASFFNLVNAQNGQWTMLMLLRLRLDLLLQLARLGLRLVALGWLEVLLRHLVRGGASF